MNLPKRKQIRLHDHDYAAPGAYFITICTHDRKCILSEIAVGEGLAPPEPGLAPPEPGLAPPETVVDPPKTHLSPIGKCVEEQIHQLPLRYPTVAVDKYCIMPNHIHLIVSICDGTGGASPSPTLFDVVRVLKSMTTRLSRATLGEGALWQRSYYEHVIRNENEYQEIWTYIDGNPVKWLDDRYYNP